MSSDQNNIYVHKITIFSVLTFYYKEYYIILIYHYLFLPVFIFNTIQTMTNKILNPPMYNKALKSKRIETDGCNLQELFLQLPRLNRHKCTIQTGGLKRNKH